MKLFIPGAKSPESVLKRVTHIGIAAHQDDLEIMALDGILKGYRGGRHSFFGVVVTDGAGSTRNAAQAKLSGAAFSEARDREQVRAARIGRYAGVAFLKFSSDEVKLHRKKEIARALADLLKHARPETVYTHNLADKHATHVAVALRTVEALRSLPPSFRPKNFYGCEVWRDLDWLSDSEKVSFDVSGSDALSLRLLKAFKSQNTSGKRYDLAALGRRKAHATFSESHQKNRAESVLFAMDLAPLLKAPGTNVKKFVSDKIRRFQLEAEKTIQDLT